MMWKGLQGALKGRGVETIKGSGDVHPAHERVGPDLEDGDTREVSAPALGRGDFGVDTLREMPFAPFDGAKVIISSDHALHRRNCRSLPT